MYNTRSPPECVLGLAPLNVSALYMWSVPSSWVCTFRYTAVISGNRGSVGDSNQEPARTADTCPTGRIEKGE